MADNPPPNEPIRNLWAPWRMEYIRALGGTGTASGCFLCDYFAHPQQDTENLVLWRTEHTIAVLNRFPYTNGHMLIAPAEHVPTLESLDDGRMLELMQLARDAQTLLVKAFGAQGFNVGANFGHCAGAGLPDHLHLHVVPRWVGDTNYMAVLGDVRVIPQALDDCYEQLSAAADKLGLPRLNSSPTEGPT